MESRSTNSCNEEDPALNLIVSPVYSLNTQRKEENQSCETAAIAATCIISFISTSLKSAPSSRSRFMITVIKKQIHDHVCTTFFYDPFFSVLVSLRCASTTFPSLFQKKLSTSTSVSVPCSTQHLLASMHALIALKFCFGRKLCVKEIESSTHSTCAL